jgi:hypothetical protein
MLMKTLKSKTTALVLMIVAMTVTAFAQGPVQKEVVLT